MQLNIFFVFSSSAQFKTPPISWLSPEPSTSLSDEHLVGMTVRYRRTRTHPKRQKEKKKPLKAKQVLWKMSQRGQLERASLVSKITAAAAPQDHCWASKCSVWEYIKQGIDRARTRLSGMLLKSQKVFGPPDVRPAALSR